MSLLKAECFLWLILEESLRKTWNPWEIQCTFAGWRWRGPCEKDLQAAFSSWERCPAEKQHEHRGLRPTTARNWNLPTTWMLLEAVFPYSFQTRTEPSQHLTSAMQYPQQKSQPHHTIPDLWLTELQTNKWVLYAAKFVKIVKQQ